MNGVWFRRLVASTLIALVLLGALTLRTVLRGQNALAESELAFDQGQLTQAVQGARAAALAYVPGAPHVASAQARLAAIARGAEATGDVATARLAWGALLRAAGETQHWFQPHTDARAAARAGLARLDAAEVTRRAATPAAAAPSPAAAAPPAVEPLAGAERWRLLAIALGFVSWVLALGWAALRGLDGRGQLAWRSLLWSGVGCGLGAGFWVLAVLGG